MFIKKHEILKFSWIDIRLEAGMIKY